MRRTAICATVLLLSAACSEPDAPDPLTEPVDNLPAAGVSVEPVDTTMAMRHMSPETDEEYAERSAAANVAAEQAEARLAADPAIVAIEAEHGVDLVPPIPPQASPQGMPTEVTEETLDANRAYMDAIDRADTASGYQPGITDGQTPDSIAPDGGTRDAAPLHDDAPAAAPPASPVQVQRAGGSTENPAGSTVVDRDDSS